MANTTIPSELIQASVALGGSPTTTTQSASDNTTKIATTAYVTAAVNALIDSAPGTMNTLNEIAAALNDDAAFNTTVTNAIATKLPLAGGTMTGNLIVNASLDISGDIDVDGTTNLDVVDIDGAVDMASTLGVSGVVTANAGVVVDEMTIDGDTLTATDEFIIDAASHIKLDADSGNIIFRDAGSNFSKIINSSGDVLFSAETQDKDIKFNGNDGGAAITAFSLDMSDAGSAFFNNDIYVPDQIIHTGDTDTYMQFHQANSWRVVTAGAERMNIIGASVVFNDDSADQDFRVESNGNTHMLFVDGGNNRVGIGTDSPSTLFSVIAADGVSDNNFVGVITNAEATDGRSFGLGINAGSNGSDIALNVNTHDAGANLMRLKGSGACHFPNAANFGIGTDSANFTLGVHKASVGSNYIQITNSDTGSGAGDGFLVGVASDEAATVWMQENKRMVFGTNNTERMRIHSSGNITSPYNSGFQVTGPAGVLDQSSAGSQSILSDRLNTAGGGGGHNIGGDYNTSTGIYTAPVAGRYLFGYTFRWETASFIMNNYLRMYISINDGNDFSIGHQINGRNEAFTSFMAMSGSAIVSLSAGDTVRVKGGLHGGTGKFYGSESSFYGILMS